MSALALRQTSEPTPGPLSEVVFYACDPVEIFRAGDYEGETYTTADLDDMVRNFAQFFVGASPPLFAPLVLGHEETLEDNTAVEAAGKVARLWRDGDLLMAQFTEIPADMAQRLEEGKFRKVSAEIYPDAPPGVPVDGMVLRRVALLGGWPPKVKGLADIPPPKQYGECKRLPTLTASRDLRLFAELKGARHMANRPEMEKAVMDKGVPEKDVKAMSEDGLAATYAMCGIKPHADPEPAAIPDAKPAVNAEGDTPAESQSRPEMEKEAIQRGNDAAAVAELSDDELKALLAQPAPDALGEEGTDDQGNPKEPKTMSVPGIKVHGEPAAQVAKIVLSAL